MSELTLSFIAKTFQLACSLPDFTVGKITTDSRNVEKNDVFFALSGEKFDGHDFVDEVLAKGAVCIVSRCVHKTGTLKVVDTLQALAQLAKAWRKANPNTKVLAITGSSGKTTLKEMTAAILRKTFGENAVLYTKGNLNNHIGLPLTLLGLRNHHQFAVLEMGMNHFGELAFLSDIAQANIALINNALNAHIGNGFDGVGDIAKAKSEIYTGLQNDGIAIFPANNVHQNIFQAACLNHAQRTFGIENGDIFSDNIRLLPTQSYFDLHMPHQTVAVSLPAAGRHNVLNATAAAALCADFATAEQIAAGLADYQPVGSRLKMFQAACGTQIIDDTYNANPDSMKAAIDVLSAFPAPRILVMGDMGELGEKSAEFHAEVGRYAQQKNIEKALFIGEFSQNAAAAFGNNAQWFAHKSDLTNHLKTLLTPQTCVLVKGSRFMEMEKIVQAIE